MSEPASEKPVLYLFYGDNALEIEDNLSSLQAKMGGDPSMAEMNTTHLQGKEASLNVLQDAAYALPFLAERRLVIVHGLPSGLGSSEARGRFEAFLDGLPETTALVLAVTDTFQGKRAGWKLMNKDGAFILKWAAKQSGRVYTKECRSPAAYEMAGWIVGRARQAGGQFQPQAAAALAAATGPDTGLAYQEIVKLLTYVDYRRPVELEDVQELTTPGGQADIFAMVDAIAVGNAGQALRNLDVLLQEQDPFSLFGMIARQFRLLLLAREAIDRSGRVDKKTLASQLSVHEFVADKLLAQAPRYTLVKLEQIYHRLLEMDRMIKTGQIDPVIALQTFIATLA